MKHQLHEVTDYSTLVIRKVFWRFYKIKRTVGARIRPHDYIYIGFGLYFAHKRFFADVMEWTTRELTKTGRSKLGLR